MKEKSEKIWDVVVVGGGPAGMMAAARAAERGKSVILLEKNGTLGKKLLITGGGRCNVTNNTPDPRELTAKYKKNGKFLFSALAGFGVSDTLDFFHKRGMETKEENEGRVFPVSNKAKSVLDALVSYMKESGVTTRLNSEVASITKETDVFIISLKDGMVVKAVSCIVAVGGTSRPDTGSTGDGFVWVKGLGHKINENDAALVPVALSDEWAKKLSGVALSDIKLTSFQNGEKQEVQKGKLLFTHVGLSGPAVLNMSRSIGELLRYGSVELRLDLFPKLDHAAIRQEIQDLLVAESNKKIKNVLGLIIPSALVEPILELAKINADTFDHSVRSEERTKLAATLKEIPLHVSGLLGEDKAIVSSGGVMPEEIDFKTMRSRIVPNLFVAGDMLDIDRPSGGYSLQICWTTGYVAGNNC